MQKPSSPYKIRYFSVAAIAIAAVVFAVVYNGANTQQSGAKAFTITTSFYPLTFFTSQIVGNHATVMTITPAGSEPHDYEPTSQDVAHIEDSQLLVLNGGMLESWGDRVQTSLKGSPTTVISVGTPLAQKTLAENGQTIQDPHVWLDPLLAKQEVAAIADAVKKIDPANAQDYTANVQQLEKQLDDLDQSFRTGLASCQQTEIITSHAAFGYLGARYGLTQISISGISPDEEPSAQTLANIADTAQLHRTAYIFFESLVSPKFAQTIANEIGAKTLVLNPLEGLTQDEVSSGATYFSVMQDNLNNLRIALGCQ